MAARIHPALSQSLGGVGVVVSVKFWFGRRRLFSPGCGCGSGCGSGFGSGGFLFVVLSYAQGGGQRCWAESINEG